MLLQGSLEIFHLYVLVVLVLLGIDIKIKFSFLDTDLMAYEPIPQELS